MPKLMVLSVVLVLTLTALAGCLLDTGSDVEQTPDLILEAKFIGFTLYQVRVVNISSSEPLENFYYNLKDSQGKTIETDEIALQNLSGKWRGIDTTWDAKTPERTVANGGAYSDPVQAQIRIDAVQYGNHEAKPYQRGEGNISLLFYDEDRNGMLTVGDYFYVRQKGDRNPESNWSLEIRYNPTLSKLVFLKLGNDEVSPIIQLNSNKNSDGSYSIDVIKVSIKRDLEAFKYFLRDNNGRTYQWGEIGLQNLSGEWWGIDTVWDEDGSWDVIDGNAQADRSTAAGGPYSDPSQAQTRIDAVQAGSQTTGAYQRKEGTISVQFYDNDQDGKLTSGDIFTVLGNSATHEADDDYTLAIHYDITGDVSGEVMLGS